MKISFDFDNTISLRPMQELCKKFMLLGAEIFVVTSRATTMNDGAVKMHNKDLFEVTDRLGIKRENIIFTEFDDKYHFTKDFDIHFDDSESECGMINDFPSTCLSFLYDHNYRQENNQKTKF